MLLQCSQLSTATPVKMTEPSIFSNSQFKGNVAALRLLPWDFQETETNLKSLFTSFYLRKEKKWAITFALQPSQTQVYSSAELKGEDLCLC